jgi:hypothetical protein
VRSSKKQGIEVEEKRTIRKAEAKEILEKRFEKMARERAWWSS